MNGKTSLRACCAPIAKPTRATDRRLADLAKALGHPARIRILRLLLAEDVCVAGSIVARLPLSQSTVSQHLKVLREAGLVSACADGPRMCYCVDPRAIGQFTTLIAGLCPLAKDPP